MSDKFPKPSGDCITDRMRQRKAEAATSQTNDHIGQTMQINLKTGEHTIKPDSPTCPQDSRPDTLEHITRVQSLIGDAINKLAQRAANHDLSKLEEPEKSAFDRLKALSLSGMDYGSPEYRACLKAEKPAIQHHYDHNSHHPEHFKLWACPLCKEVFPESETAVAEVYESKPRFCPKCCPVGSLFEATLEPHPGVDGMSLLDVLEMLLDWKAATERMKNGGDIRASLVHNTERFKLSPQLVKILGNTIREFGW